uniref:F-box/kelch-repeat protein At3g23880-like n=1 Tax=Erigeron canadensis TaxID=72917 RepID=UPI001CB9C62E|nr:F-box/kelch-repeat protein At3g23880-like [Erigeron canadensis]
MSDNLPHDLHIQILKHLPLISILRFRTVCKSWNSLITTHHFMLAHIQTNRHKSLIIRFFDRTHKTEQYILGKDDQTFGSHFSNIKFPCISSTNAYHRNRIVGYSNGVFCLTDDLFDSMHMVALWNPSIRKSVKVTVKKYEQGSPYNMMTVLGFGVCPMTSDPKVVKIVYLNDFSIPSSIRVRELPFVEVFSVSLGCWRMPFGDGSYPRSTILVSWSQVCYNGIIHWVACDKGHDSSHLINEVRFCSMILSFDLVSELFVEMMLPDALTCQNVLNLSITERKGCLAMMVYNLEKGMESCGVWVMREYGVIGSWERMCVVRLPGLLRRSVGFRVNGDVVLALKNNELVFVDCDGNVKSLGIYGNIRSFFLGTYMESLTLINQMDGQIYCNNEDEH